jgi:hypothetical protein
MKIKLIRTGGFIPITKESEIEADLTNDDLANLIKIIELSPSVSKIKDGTYYELLIGDEQVSINPDNIPEGYKEIFEKLKRNLKIVHKGK